MKYLTTLIFIYPPFCSLIISLEDCFVYYYYRVEVYSLYLYRYSIVHNINSANTFKSNENSNKKILENVPILRIDTAYKLQYNR